MRLKTTMRLLVALALSLAAIRFLDSGMVRTNGKKAKNPKLVPRHFKDLDGISVKSRGEPAKEFLLNRGLWHLVSPVKAVVSQETVQKIIDAAESAPLLGETPKKDMLLRGLGYPDYGLDNPACTLEFRSPHSSLAISLGDETPSKDGYFAKLGSSESVFVTSGALLENSLAKLEDFTDRRLCRANLREVDIVAIERAAAPTLRIVRSADRKYWKTTSPEEGIADWGEMERFFEALGAARICRIEEDGNPSFGKRPEVAIKLYSKKAQFPSVISFYGANGASGLVLAKNDIGLDVTVSTNTASALSITENHIRDRRVLQSAPTLDVKSFSITPTNGAPVTLDKTVDGEWIMVSPVRHPADQKKASHLLGSVLGLVAKSYVPSGAIPGGKSLPSVQFSVYCEGTTNRIDFCLPEHGGGMASAVVDGAGYAAMIAAEDMADLLEISSDPSGIASRDVLSIDEDAIISISIAKEDGTGANLIASDGGFALEEQPEGTLLDAVAAREIASALCRLSSIGIAALNPAGLSGYGLDKPRIAVKASVAREDGSVKEIALFLGDAAPGGGVYMATADGTAVYEVSAHVFSVFNQQILTIPPSAATQPDGPKPDANE